MSFLDTPKTQLNKDIFNKNNRIRKDVLEEIKTFLYRIVPNGAINHLYLLGSMAGYQYNDESDIDILVILNDGYDREVYHKKKKLIPTMYLSNTLHEITFFFQNLSDPKFEDSKFGVYDITNDVFIIEPHVVEYDPKEKFKEQMWYAEKILDRINELVEEYKKDQEDLEKLQINSEAYKNKLREIAEDSEKLVGWMRKLDQDRKVAYYGGWGIPRESQQNITYKMFEYSKNKKLIAELEKQFGEEIPNLL